MPKMEGQIPIMEGNKQKFANDEGPTVVADNDQQ